MVSSKSVGLKKSLNAPPWIAVSRGNSRKIQRLAAADNGKEKEGKVGKCIMIQIVSIAGMSIAYVSYSLYE